MSDVKENDCITINISDLLLSDKEKKLLEQQLNCGDNLIEIINPIAKAAVQEYIDMIVGKHKVSRYSDLMDNRVLLLIKYFFEGIPSEIELSRLLLIKQSDAKRILSSIESNHRLELEEIVNQTISKVISKIDEKKNQTSYSFRCDSPNLIAQMNDILARNDENESEKLNGDLELIQKEQNKTNQYKIMAGSLSVLKGVVEK